MRITFDEWLNSILSMLFVGGVYEYEDRNGSCAGTDKDK